MSQMPAATMIVRSNELVEKVERLDGVSVDELAARANTMVEKATANYETWVQEDLRKLRNALGKLSDSHLPQAPNIAAVYEIAADIGDQGSVCGYRLVTVVAGLLCKFIDQVRHLDEREITLVEVHINSLQAIVAQRIRDDDTALAQHLVRELESAVARLRDERPNLRN